MRLIVGHQTFLADVVVSQSEIKLFFGQVWKQIIPRTNRGRGKRAELKSRGFLVLPADREMYSFIEGVPDNKI